MQTIELVGEKSVVKFDVEIAPATAFILFQGRAYHADEPSGLLWQVCTGMPPDGASVTCIANDGCMTAPPVEPAEQITTEPAPAAIQTPPPPEPAGHAEPDHAETV